MSSISIEGLKDTTLSDDIGPVSLRVPEQMTAIVNQRRDETRTPIPYPSLRPADGMSENLIYSIPNVEGLKKFINITKNEDDRNSYTVSIQAYPSPTGPNNKTSGLKNTVPLLQEEIGVINSLSPNADIRKALDEAYSKVTEWRPGNSKSFR